MSDTDLFGNKDNRMVNTDSTIPAISLWQPWASLWMSGRKRFETRHWPIKIRGLIAVHAAKKIVVDVGSDLEEILIDEFGGHWAMDLPRGCILGTLKIVECWRTEDLSPGREEAAQGDFHPGRYAWEGAWRVPFKKPVPWRGRQGLFRVSLSVAVGSESEG